MRNGSMKVCLTLAALLLAPSFAFAATFERSLSLGASGSDVSALQQILKDKGFYAYPEITGYFGQLTKDALAAYQASLGLEAAGELGPKTRALLNGGASAQPSTLSSLVTALQQLLRNAGYFEVPLSGVLDSATLAAAQSVSTGVSSASAPKRSGGSPSHANDEDDEDETTAPDTMAPVLSSISSGSPRYNRTTVTWTTDEASDSYVEYGTTASYGSVASSSVLGTSHTIGLYGLDHSTTYHYRVRSADSAMNAASSSDQTFTTDGLDSASVALIPFGDSRTAVLHYDTSHFGGSNLTPFFWANTKNGQPILYTGNFGDGGDTTIQMQSRIQTALASKIPGDMNFISIWGGVNDIGTLSNTGPGSDGYYQTIADRIIDIAEQSMDAGVRPIIFTESGSTAFTSAQVETTLNLNQALSDWVDANQDSDYAPILFDAASIIWDGTPTTSIAFKANYAYDGLHLQVPGSEAVGDEFYELLTEHVVPTLRTPTGSELLQNTTYATTTGGTAGSGVTGAVPANWRTVRDNATVDSITYTTVGNKAHFVASASSTNVLNGFRFRQDPSITGLVGGDKLEAWGTVDIQGGPVALAECSLSLSLNYSDTTFALFYDGRTTSSRGDLSSTGARTLRIRAPLATVNAAKTLSSINYYFQCRMHASGATTVDFYDASLRKI